MPEESRSPGGDRTALNGVGLITLLIGAFLSTYTFSSVNIALPDIASDLSAAPDTLQLVMGAYGITFALLLIPGGRLGDRFGRRRLFVTGLVAYVVTSVAAGTAGSMLWLIGLRGLQGIAAALLVPQILATIQATTAGPARIRAIAAFSTLAGLGTAAGQLLGGVLLGLDPGGTGWRSVLWLGAAAGLLALPGTPWVVATRSPSRGRLDVRGTVLLAVGVCALLVPLNVGPVRGWPWWSVALLVLAPVGLAAFWRHERRTDDAGRVQALVPPRVLAHRPLVLGLVVVALMFAAYGAFMYEFALVTQQGIGLSPLAGGLWLGPFTLAFVAASARIRAFTRRLGAWTPAVGGVGIAVGMLAVGLVVALQWPAPSQWLLQPALVVLGGAMSLTYNPAVTAVLEQIPAALAGLSGGLFSTVQQAALAFGVAIYGGLFTFAAAGPPEFGTAFLVCLAVQSATIVVLVLVTLRMRTLARTAAEPVPVVTAPSVPGGRDD